MDTGYLPVARFVFDLMLYKYTWLSCCCCWRFFFRWSCSLVVFTSSWSKFSTGTYFHLDCECSCLKFRRRKKHMPQWALLCSCVCVCQVNWYITEFKCAIPKLFSNLFLFLSNNFFHTEFATLLLASDVCHLSFRYNNEMRLTGAFLCVWM